jgi:hypothetical protein
MRRIKPLKAFYFLRISARVNVPRVPYPNNTGEMVVRDVLTSYAV